MVIEDDINSVWYWEQMRGKSVEHTVTQPAGVEGMYHAVHLCVRFKLQTDEQCFSKFIPLIYVVIVLLSNMCPRIYLLV